MGRCNKGKQKKKRRGVSGVALPRKVQVQGNYPEQRERGRGKRISIIPPERERARRAGLFQAEKGEGGKNTQQSVEQTGHQAGEKRNRVPPKDEKATRS